MAVFLHSRRRRPSFPPLSNSAMIFLNVLTNLGLGLFTPWFLFFYTTGIVLGCDAQLNSVPITNEVSNGPPWCCIRGPADAIIFWTKPLLPKSESGNKSLPCWANWFACCLWDGSRIESEIEVAEAADLGPHHWSRRKKKRFTGDHLCGFPLHQGAKKMYF